MDTKIKNITNEALKLPLSARAYIAEMLLESLDFEEDFPISKEWMDEIQKRCCDIDNGKIGLISGEKALSNLLKKYS